MVEVSGTRSSDEHYPGPTAYLAVTTTVPSCSSLNNNALEASVWQHYRNYYQSQFYRQPYLTQYPPTQVPSSQYPAAGSDDPVQGSGAEPWFHSHQQYYQHHHTQSQLHLANSVGITPTYSGHFREMAGVCYDPVY